MTLPLKTTRLEIRDIAAGDLGAVHACTSDPQITRWFPWGPNSEDETRDFLERVVRGAMRHPRESYVLAVVVPEHGLIGVCFLDHRGERKLELGYYLHRDHWGQGFASEAVEAVVAFALRDLGAREIFARVEPANTASVRVLERVGFHLDDQASRNRFIKGEWRDSLLFVLRADP